MSVKTADDAYIKLFRVIFMVLQSYSESYGSTILFRVIRFYKVIQSYIMGL